MRPGSEALQAGSGQGKSECSSPRPDLPREAGSHLLSGGPFSGAFSMLESILGQRKGEGGKKGGRWIKPSSRVCSWPLLMQPVLKGPAHRERQHGSKPRAALWLELRPRPPGQLGSIAARLLGPSSPSSTAPSATGGVRGHGEVLGASAQPWVRHPGALLGKHLLLVVFPQGSESSCQKTPQRVRSLCSSSPFNRGRDGGWGRGGQSSESRLVRGRSRKLWVTVLGRYN